MKRLELSKLMRSYLINIYNFWRSFTHENNFGKKDEACNKKCHQPYKPLFTYNMLFSIRIVATLYDGTTYVYGGAIFVLEM